MHILKTKDDLKSTNLSFNLGNQKQKNNLNTNQGQEKNFNLRITVIEDKNIEKVKETKI